MTLNVLTKRLRCTIWESWNFLCTDMYQTNVRWRFDCMLVCVKSFRFPDTVAKCSLVISNIQVNQTFAHRTFMLIHLMILVTCWWNLARRDPFFKQGTLLKFFVMSQLLTYRIDQQDLVMPAIDWWCLCVTTYCYLQVTSVPTMFSASCNLLITCVHIDVQIRKCCRQEKASESKCENMVDLFIKNLYSYLSYFVVEQVNYWF